jgi:hypothetical protein
VTVPLVVIALLLLATISGGSDETSGSGAGPTPPVTASAPPQASRQSAACTKVLAQLPVELGKLAPRIVHTTQDTPFVVAWGDPAVVFRCGVDRPASLKPGSSAQYFANGPETGPFYDVTRSGDANVWTTVDRGPYISITVPAGYQGADVLPPISQAIAKALPAVCTTDPSAPNPDQLCTRRKT